MTYKVIDLGYFLIICGALAFMLYEDVSSGKIPSLHTMCFVLVSIYLLYKKVCEVISIVDLVVGKFKEWNRE